MYTTPHADLQRVREVRGVDVGNVVARQRQLRQVGQVGQVVHSPDLHSMRPAASEDLLDVHCQDPNIKQARGS